MMTLTPPRPRRALTPALASTDGLLGRVADFTLGTAVVLWHAVLADRERRRHARLPRTWSSTR